MIFMINFRHTRVLELEERLIKLLISSLDSIVVPQVFFRLWAYILFTGYNCFGGGRYFKSGRSG